MSYILFKKLGSLQLDKNSYSKLKTEKEEISRTTHRIVPVLKEILKKQDKICRICLQAGSKALFESESADLAAEIQFVLGIEVIQDDGGPQYLCLSCESGVLAAAELKRLANISRWRLQQEMEMIAESVSKLSDLDFEPNEFHGGYFITRDSGTARVWRCGKCRRVFENQEEFLSHERQVTCRRRVESYMCEVCGKEFQRAYMLKRHGQVHSSELRHACNMCPYRGRSREALISHLRVHSGEKPAHCPHCPATFASPSNLASHRRTHYPPKFTCQHCVRTFMFKQSLQNHLISQHSNIKAYHCSFCAKAFATNRQLRRHELRSHNCPRRSGGPVPLYIQLQMRAQQ